MSKHTPKPWIFTGAGIVGNANGMTYTVAEVNGPNRLDLIPMREANKALVCAAPELLEALEALLESAKSSNASLNWATGLNDEPASFDQARAAIRKARGE